MEEIERLRAQLRAAEERALEERSLREEEQRRREEEQRRREEEQRRREEAEERASSSRPLTLHQYLESCHSLRLAIEVITDLSLTTQGDTTNPTGRIYPRRILPWVTFAEEQEKIWNQLSSGSTFPSEALFPSQHQLDYVRSLLRPVSSEIGLRDGERDVVENAVRMLMDAAYNDLLLRGHLGLDGTVSFESHTNLGLTDDSLSESMDQVSIGSIPPNRATRRRKARGKGNQADQFCIYRTSDDRKIPAVAIEYKPPHKLQRDDVTTGLVSEIQPDRDVINQEGEGFAFAARRLTTAVVTQLFSYMIGKGIQYGYVCTGETYVFLHIPDDDPSCVYYYVCVPSLDVEDDDDTRLHRTAVAQAFAFVLQAIRSPPPSQAWHDAAEHLDLWAVEYEDVLRSIPATDRKPQRETPYKPQRWKGFARSPIQTRSRCLPPQDLARRPDGDSSDEDDDGDQSPCPTPNPAGVFGRGGVLVTSTDSESNKKQEHSGSAASHRGNVQDRPYCTHKCLLGLAIGGPLDTKCPNYTYHGTAHIDRSKFLSLTKHQLAVDRGKDADCAPLYLSGSRGALFKVRLSSHGYTLVAKGVEALDAKHLRHEEEIYNHLRDLQGQFIPVCLGNIDLIKPYYYDCGVYTHFMFLSYGGQPILKELGQVSVSVANKILAALGRLHQHKVLHRDAEPRNVLYDKDTGSCMIVDLMLAETYARQPLGSISQNRKRTRELTAWKEKDMFASEMQSLRASLLS